MGSPISKVPYDILSEIFIHCLPPHHLYEEPNVTTAPMLLCQICSYWRTVALSSATLWSHLYFFLSIASNSYDSPDTVASDWVVPENQYRFLQWWKKNQRAMAPSIRLELDWEYKKGSKLPEFALGPVEMTSFYEYISSARYFQTESVYWLVLAERIRCGYPIVCPNPHTLVTFEHERRDISLNNSSSFYDIQLSLLPNSVFSNLRRLSIHYDMLPDGPVIPNSWTALTHISFVDIQVGLRFWFPLIRAAPNLQWGMFDILALLDSDYALPTKCTLHHLSTLSVTAHTIEDASATDFPLSILFTELQLPTLRNLSLSSDEFHDSEQFWYDHRAIPELYTILRSTSNITMLTLGYGFLSLESNEYSAVILPAIRDVEPIWKYVPHLMHLRLEVMDANNRSTAQLDEAWNALVENLCYCDNPWLDFANPACPIQEITMVDKMRLDTRSDSFANSMMSSVRKHIEKGPQSNIIFQVVSESEGQSAVEVWDE